MLGKLLTIHVLHEDIEPKLGVDAQLGLARSGIRAHEQHRHELAELLPEVPRADQRQPPVVVAPGQQREHDNDVCHVVRWQRHLRPDRLPHRRLQQVQQCAHVDNLVLAAAPGRSRQVRAIFRVCFRGPLAARRGLFLDALRRVAPHVHPVPEVRALELQHRDKQHVRVDRLHQNVSV